MLKKLVLFSMIFTALAPFAWAQTEDALKPGLHDSSEAGIVIVSGNSEGQTYNLKQSNTYGWGDNGLRFHGSFLETSANSVNTARFWDLGGRYERKLTDDFGVYAGELIESDIFSGYLQRYSTDVGGKGYIYHQEDFTWTGELGYRHTIENQLAGQETYNLIRIYTEAVRNITKTTSAKLWVEYLPNLTQWTDYQANGEASISATVSEVFSIKTGYLVKFRNLPPAGVEKRADSWFTTSLVAKF